MNNKLSKLWIIFFPLMISSSVSADLCQQKICTILGSNQADIIVGTEGDDVICGLQGNDVIKGLGGNDLICGGNGDDVLEGGDGNDVIVGGLGNDILNGGNGKNEFYDFQGINTGKVNKSNQKNNKDKKSSTLTGKSRKLKHFKINNKKIIAPDGGQFIPRGVNIFPWHGNSSSISLITQDCWNFNMVRLHAWILPRQTSPWKNHLVYAGKPVIFDPDSVPYTVYDVAPLIENYTNRGIVVLFDIHDMIGQYFEGQDLIDYLVFIEDFARRYKDNPYVWLDIHNEPGNFEGLTGDFSRWRAEIPVIVDTIRAIAPEMPVLIPGTAWGQDTGPNWHGNFVIPGESALLANADIINNYQNVIATFHVYDQWNSGGVERMQDFVDQLNATLKIPVIVGEYGSYNNGSTLLAIQNLHNLLQMKKYNDLGRIAWVWDANDLNDLTISNTGGGPGVDSCVNPTNLTPFGQFVWEDNH